MIKATQIHCGQYKRYGDFFRVWNIQTDMPKEEVIKWCFENLYKRVVPPSGEFHANIRCGGPRHSDLEYYFAGYYTIEDTEDGFKFSICEPYAD